MGDIKRNDPNFWEFNDDPQKLEFDPISSNASGTY
jgi:hypothetical protein